jgi:hypothetical protein
VKRRESGRDRGGGRKGKEGEILADGGERLADGKRLREG